MTIHTTITQDRIVDAAERSMFGADNPGFCTACGEEQEGVEPDATRIECDACGQRAVHGAEMLLLMTVA
jgi:hypothetical protein